MCIEHTREEIRGQAERRPKRKRTRNERLFGRSLGDVCLLLDSKERSPGATSSLGGNTLEKFDADSPWQPVTIDSIYLTATRGDGSSEESVRLREQAQIQRNHSRRYILDLGGVSPCVPSSDRQNLSRPIAIFFFFETRRRISQTLFSNRDDNFNRSARWEIKWRINRNAIKVPFSSVQLVSSGNLSICNAFAGNQFSIRLQFFPVTGQNHCLMVRNISQRFGLHFVQFLIDCFRICCTIPSRRELRREIVNTRMYAKLCYF